MVRPKLGPREIIERRRLIDALVAEGEPIDHALRLTGLLPDEYEVWRSEYAGLMRTLGPLATVPSRARKGSRRAAPDRPDRPHS